MKPGERIPLIRATADALLEQFDDASLILSQFKVNTANWSWSADSQSRKFFLTSVLGDAPDDILSSLHDYLIGGDQAPVSTPEENDLWGPEPLRVFLSHKWEDAAWVSSLRDDLSSYGISGFVAHRDIAPTRKWREVIKAGLRTCDVFVAVLHKDFHDSQWCDQEVGWALGRGIPIVTVRRELDFTRGHDGFLEEAQDITLDPARGSGHERAAAEVFRASIRSVKPLELARRTIAEAFVSSGSYDNTRRLWSAIDRQEQWERASLDRLKFAVQTNSQVYNANVDGARVPLLVDSLVEKFDPAPINPWGDDSTPF